MLSLPSCLPGPESITTTRLAVPQYLRKRLFLQSLQDSRKLSSRGFNTIPCSISVLLLQFHTGQLGEHSQSSPDCPLMEESFLRFAGEQPSSHSGDEHLEHRHWKGEAPSWDPEHAISVCSFA